MQENIIIGIDSRPAEEGGDVVVRKLDAIKRESEATGRSIDNLARSHGEAARAAAGHASSTENLARASGATSRNIVDVGRGVALTRAEMDQLKRSLDNAGASAYRHGAAWTGLSKDIMAGTGAMDKNGKALKSMHKDLSELEKRFAPATAAANKYHDTLDRIARLEAKKLIQPSAATLFRTAAKTELDGSMGSAHGGGPNAGVIRESLVLMRELARGNYTRMAGSATLLAQYSGGLEKLRDGLKGGKQATDEFGNATGKIEGGLSIARIATIGLVGGLAALTVGLLAWISVVALKGLRAAAELDEHFNRLGRSAQLSGEHIIAFGRQLDVSFGLARGSSATMAAEFAHNTAITSSQIDATTKAAAALAYTLGGDTKTAAQQLGNAMSKIAAGDVKALDGSFSELDANSRQYITTLIRTGRLTEAQTVLNQRLTDSVTGPQGAANAWHQFGAAFMDNITAWAQNSSFIKGFNDLLLAHAQALRDGAAAMRDYNGVATQMGQAGSSVTVPLAAAGPAGGRGGKSLNTNDAAYFQSRGWSPEQSRGFAAGIAAEGGSDGFSSLKDSKGRAAFGVGQWRGSRQRQLFDRFGPNPSHNQQLAFADWELRGGNAGMAKAVRMGGNTAEGVGDAYLRYGMAPGAKDLPDDLGRMRAALNGGRPMAVNPNAPTAGTIADVRRDALAEANMLPEDRTLRDRSASIAQQLMADKKLSGPDAKRIADEQARRELSAPRDLDFRRSMSDAQFKTSMIGQTPEQRARAEALRSAQMTSGGGDLSRSSLTRAQEGAVTGNVSAAMDKERQQRLTEMLAGMKEEARLAAMLPQEAEKARAVEKARLIINDGFVLGSKQVSAELKMQVEEGVKSRDAAKLEGSIRAQIQGSQFESVKLTREIGLRQKLNGDALNDEMQIEQAMWPARLAVLQAVGSLEDVRVAANLKLLETQLRQTAELDKQAAALRRANDLTREYGGGAGANYLQKEKLKVDGADIAKIKGTVPDDVYRAITAGFEKASWESANYFKLQFLDQIDEIAHSFGGKFGAIIQSVTGMLSKLSAGAKDANKGGFLGQIAGALGSAGMPGVKTGFEKEQQNQLSKIFSGHIAGIGSSFKSFQGSLQGMFGKGATAGSFQAGLGKVLGAAGMGMQMGDMANGLMKAIGIKSSKIGAEIGGAIGMAAFGPIGGAIGSIAGGLIGGAFKKPKYGGATISSSGNGQVQTGTAFGNDKGAGAAGIAAGGSVGSALTAIAQQLGGSLGAFGNIKIGQYKGDWRVNELGNDLGGKGNVKGLNTRHLTDEADAIAYAIGVAIKKGAIQGISEASKRVLTSAKDPTSVLSAVAAYEKLGVELLKVTDPAKGAIEEFVRGFKTMNDQLKAAGYTAAELGKLEQVYAAQRKELMKQLTQPYRDLINNITNGPNSGKSIALQYADAKTKFEGYAAAPAGSVKTDDFTSAAQAFFDLSSKMFGTTTQQFATDRSSIVGASNAAIGHVEAVGPPELLNAIVQGAGETVNQLQLTNDMLAKIYGALGGSVASPSGTGTGTYNGKLIGADASDYMNAY